MRIAWIAALLACHVQAAPSESPKPSPRTVAIAIQDSGSAELDDTAPRPELLPLPYIASCSRLAVVIVIDRSGSIPAATIEAAKSGVVKAAAALHVDDCIEVLAFDSVPERIVPLRRAGRSLEKEVSAIEPQKKTTEIATALEVALDDVRKAVNATQRRVIIATDGRAPARDIEHLARWAGFDSIAISTIDVGSGVHQMLLRSIATMTSGRHYVLGDESDLARWRALTCRRPLEC